MNVVALIAKRFRTDVCSAYLLEPDRANLVLAATVGLPYLLLSTTGPILQAWYARSRPDSSPYRL